ncbi:hypothetical protein G6O69_17965 [Pseudenhygromyxa sp. WMMC2535]|uniref:hypothetical protein n=1 Tax=Pseudenhygromyxa sp. WMMC2535 TaxID=2712867 RepID=UPI0015581C4D|nr:hypothetical protein [Pseudenhygromyxa sp. WMMC2535]NVB39735.1 hypothetical protein [Pseudenhygromyxa sp. WMMC2535]
MGDERRWAAGYQFLEELWRGRNRIIYDRSLEQPLHRGEPEDGPLATLIDALIPRASADARVWMALDNDRRAASFARDRGGTIFLDLDAAGEIAGDEPWEVALVDLGEGGLSDESGGLSPELEALLELLGERASDDPERSVAITVGCAGLDEDACYEQLADLVDELFGDGRVYGLTRPRVAAFYDFGPVLESEGGGEGSDDEPGIEVDNSLGSESPRFEAFVAVIGRRLPSEGVTFVEVAGGGERQVAASAPGSSAGSSAGDEGAAALRAQLAEAQRRGDLQAIERQELLEKLELAEDRIASLEETLEVGDDEPSGEADDSPRLDAALAREQTLRWELARLRGELELAQARPVEALEAELAGLRAKLQTAEAALASRADEDELDDEDDFDDDFDDELDDGELTLIVETAQPSSARLRHWKRARGQIERLLRKLERGGRLSALELHRELKKLL